MELRERTHDSEANVDAVQIAFGGSIFPGTACEPN